MKRAIWGLALLAGLGLMDSAQAATISRLTTWTNGQVLTHSALNSEFDNIVDEFNGNISAANLAADSVASSELLENDDYTMNNLILSTTAPDVRWNPTSGDSFHAGAEYAASSGSIWFLSNVTDGQHYLRVRDDHQFELPQYANCTSGFTTGGQGRLYCKTDAWGIAQGGTGVTTVPSNGQLYIGDGDGAPTLATLTAGSNVTVTNGAGSITIASSDAVGGTNAARVKRTAGNVTTTSTTLVDFTGASITLTTGANPVIVLWEASCENNDATGTVEFNVDIDGTLQLGTEGIAFVQHATAGEFMNCSFGILTDTLTAASHTVKLQWDVETAGTGNTGCSANRACIFSVFEVVD